MNVIPVIHKYFSSVRINDKGSKPKFVSVQVQGVSTLGIIDIGADITIMGFKLLRKVVAAARLKKHGFKKADIFLTHMTERNSSCMAEWIWR